MRADLDDDIGTGQVDRSITDLTNEDGIKRVILLEVSQNVHAFKLVSATIDERSFQGLGQLLLCKDGVSEDDDLVTTSLMQLDEVFACNELIRIALVVHLLLVLGACQILLVEVRCHLAPHFDTLDVSQVSLTRQIEPVCFI